MNIELYKIWIDIFIYVHVRARTGEILLFRVLYSVLDIIYSFRKLSLKSNHLSGDMEHKNNQTRLKVQEYQTLQQGLAR